MLGPETYSTEVRFCPTKVPEAPTKGTAENARDEAARTKAY